jgi:hypothetical protein
MRRRGIAVAVAGLAVVALMWPLVGTASQQKPQAVQIIFTGKGGGRYLDHTRWLREDTRECYASLLADEDLRVQWRIAWTGTLAPGAKGYSLRSPARGNDSIAGSVNGSAVKDSCDAADEEPGWSGTTVCKAALDLHANGGLAARTTARGLRVIFRGPVFKSPGNPCQLDIRNDQLVAAVQVDRAALDRLAAGKAVTVPVGTNHPAPGVTYKAVRSCSHFPHLYDGTEYLYDCDDTLIWSGSVTIRPL